MEARQPDRDTIRDRVIALPLTEHGEPVSEKTALAILEDLRQNGSAIPEHLSRQIAELTAELGREVDIPNHILRGAIARAAIAGAAQAVSDTGQTLLDIKAFKELIQEEVDHPGAKDIPPTA